MLEGKKKRVFLPTVTVFGIVILGLAVRSGEIFLSLMVVSYLIIMYYTDKIEPEPYRKTDLDRLKIDLFLWSLFPLVFCGFGAAGILDLDLYFVFRDIALTALASELAFLIILNMDYHTSFRPNRFFTVLFITISTIGLGSIIGIIRFFNDRYLDTTYLAGNTHLMVYLIIISMIGLVIGINIRDYIESYEFFPLKNVRAEFRYKDDFTTHRKEFLEIVNSLFGKYDPGYLMVLSRILQVGIFGIALYGFLIDRVVIFAWSVFSLVFAISPDIFKRNTGYDVPSIIYFWTALVTFTYAFGRPMRFYRYFAWWPGITHLLAGTLVAVLVFSLLIYLSNISKNLYFPSFFIPIIVLLSIFPVGVFWEISEFLVDVFFERRLQAGIEDTVFDLLCNFAGTVVSLIVVYELVDGWTIEDRGVVFDPINFIKRLIKRI